jgi:hypothetical protein
MMESPSVNIASRAGKIRRPRTGNAAAATVAPEDGVAGFENRAL